ncbi:MAG: oxygen-independent coproporphyrinogen-3 oxidase [Marivirga sp.]|jgi:oxygen-independent coproporphyrinogen-3 oxidase
MGLKDDMLKAIIKEISLQTDFFKADNTVSSIYFGGGTPSILSSLEIKSILTQLKTVFNVSQGAEVTLEANPDDISEEKLKELFESGINRLSLGIQSFNSALLKWMNRTHNTNEALTALEIIKKSSFSNFSVDLIYGNPGQDLATLEQDIETLLQYNPPHISAYCLTIEEKTVLGRLLKRGKINEVEDEEAAAHFLKVNKLLTQSGYEQYEISNYCLPNKTSFHNTNYWKGIPYLGIGPGAHSFNKAERQYNVSNNAKYIKALTQDSIPAEHETLSRNDLINEYLMTALRTSEGISLEKLLIDYNFDLEKEYKPLLQQWYEQGQARISDKGTIQLTLKGKLIADKLASDLFLVD